MTKGVFLVIEGSDGSGKGTQFKLLVERLKAEGYDVATYDFPQYDQESSYYVREYLNGHYGSAQQLGPYTPSLFYALDRFNVAPKIAADIASGRVVIANRFVGSNMGHQGAKFSDSESREAFFRWLDQLEFGMLQTPRPDLNVVLLVPPETAQKLIDRKDGRRYTDKVRDIHEADLSHLESTVTTYQQMCDIFPENFVSINCQEKGELMSIPHISQLIYDKIKPLLNRVEKRKNDDLAAVEPQAEPNPYVKREANGSFTITNKGQKFLVDTITNTDQDVYVFTNKMSPITIAAAMARLSRRGDDMRVTLLDEFANNAGKDESLLKRVITAYGDDSVQQLTGVHLVVEKASNLLTKKLEWGRLAAYLEQSTRYIFFDQKDQHGRYKFHTPETLQEEHRRHYEAELNKLFDSYSEVVKKLTEHVRATSNEPEESRDVAWRSATKAQACDAARVLLPVATTATVGIYASGQALESLIMHLQSEELAEARQTGSHILREARKVLPTFLERADRPDRGGAWIAYRAQTKKKMQQLAAEKQLQPIKGKDDSAVRLTDFWPKNELDMLPHMLYEQSTLSLDELKNTIGAWSYAEKESAFRAYIGERLNRRHKPGRALETAHYTFELVCDYGIFRDLQRHRMVDALEWQSLTPHYGYDIPKLVSEAVLEDQFEACFDSSMQLYQYLLENGYELEAQYATLLGHKMRSKLTLNAREAYHFLELRTSPQGHPGYRKIAGEMFEKIAEIHPLTASGMIFINKNEDPELTRLAAERATQFKLSQFSDS